MDERIQYLFLGFSLGIVSVYIGRMLKEDFNERFPKKESITIDELELYSNSTIVEDCSKPTVEPIVRPMKRHKEYVDPNIAKNDISDWHDTFLDYVHHLGIHSNYDYILNLINKIPWDKRYKGDDQLHKNIMLKRTEFYSINYSNFTGYPDHLTLADVIVYCAYYLHRITAEDPDYIVNINEILDDILGNIGLSDESSTDEVVNVEYEFIHDTLMLFAIPSQECRHNDNSIKVEYLNFQHQLNYMDENLGDFYDISPLLYDH